MCKNHMATLLTLEGTWVLLLYGKFALKIANIDSGFPTHLSLIMDEWPAISCTHSQ